MHRLTLIVVFAVLTAPQKIGVSAHDHDEEHHHDDDSDHDHDHDHDSDDEHRNVTCLPDEKVRTRCFSGLPNTGAVLKKVGMNWLMPQLENDSYSLSGEMGFDSIDNTVSRIEQDPSYFCDHLDTIMKGLECLDDWLKTNCSFDEQELGLGRFNASLRYYCSKLHEMDVYCLLFHDRQALKTCHMQVARDYKSGSLRPKVTPYNPEKYGNMTAYTKYVKKEIACFFFYKVSSCAKRNTEACDSVTANVLYEVMKMMMSPDCVAKVSVWESEVSSTSSAMDSLSVPVTLLFVWLIAL